jgi:hypothetical protein
MYGNLIDFRAYAAARGNQAPIAATDVDATAALMRASDYIRTRYVIRFVTADDTIPEVAEATYIAAQRELATPGFWSRTYTPGEAKTLVQVDAIHWQPNDRVGAGVYGADLVVPVDGMIEALLARYTGSNIPAHFVV